MDGWQIKSKISAHWQHLKFTLLCEEATELIKWCAVAAGGATATIPVDAAGFEGRWTAVREEDESVDGGMTEDTPEYIEELFEGMLGSMPAIT